MALARVSRVYKALSDSEVAALIAKATFLQVEAGDALVAQGRPPAALYTVVVGELDAVVTYGDGEARMDRRVLSLRSGMTFGEEALVDGPSAVTVVACRTCELAAVRPLDGKLVLSQSADLRAALSRPADFARPPLLDILMQASWPTQKPASPHPIPHPTPPLPSPLAPRPRGHRDRATRAKPTPGQRSSRPSKY